MNIVQALGTDRGGRTAHQVPRDDQAILHQQRGRDEAAGPCPEGQPIHSRFYGERHNFRSLFSLIADDRAGTGRAGN